MKYKPALVILSLLSFLPVFAQSEVKIRRQPFLSGLDSPLFLTHAGDGSGRIFVVQQRGVIKVVAPGSRTAEIFLNLSSKVSQTGSERGLLGLAFHPEFTNNGYFFVNYTRSLDGATVIERYEVFGANLGANPDSGRIVLIIPQDFSNHNGGMIQFGPDGYLYIGMGDGGSANDPNNRAQDINSLLGKMLRIDPDVSGNDANPPYTNPADNPFVGVAGADEIFALGLRNPFRWSFDRGGTNELWAADVGQAAVEEVDVVVKGGNYGWRVYEGNNCTNNDPGQCNPANYVPPVFQYNHSAGRCSITGGYRYRGILSTFPSGDYVYGDYCTGEYWRWDGANQIPIEDTERAISSFGEDEYGELYLVGLGGTVEKLVRAGAPADFDGDGRTDFSVFRPSTSVWYLNNSSNGSNQFRLFGVAGDIPVPEDYDGDGIADVAVFRPSDGVWYIMRSSDSTVLFLPFGISTDIPAAGDFFGDGRSDIAIFRPQTGDWWVMDVTSFATTVVRFGAAGDIPVVGDYDGDGRDDFTIYRPSDGRWWTLGSQTGANSATQFGIASDRPVPGDYDGDGINDFAVFRPSEGIWYILQSASNTVRYEWWGTDTDIQAIGDYDGDGKDDVAVWRPSDGVWYVKNSSGGLTFFQYGMDGDLPLPAYAGR